MQCVAQATPFVGVALTMLNRRTLTSFATTTWRRATGGGPADDHGHDLQHHSGGTCEPAEAAEAGSAEERDGCR
jgi:hypothetical protein